MARIAGDAPAYSFRLVHGDSPVSPVSGAGAIATEFGFELPSVTHIIGEVLGKPAGAMAHWGYNLAVEGMLALSQVEDLSALSEEDAKDRLKGAEYAPNKVRDKAGDRGNNAHRFLELLASWGPCSLNGDEATFVHEETGAMETIQLDGYCKGVLAWWNEEMAGWNVEAVEAPVWSLKHRFCGTVDLARRHDEGPLELVDLKTHKPATQAKPAYLTDLFQLAAYRLGWEELHDETVAWNRIVVVDEKGRYFEDRRTVPMKAFEYVVGIYRVLMDLDTEEE